MNRLLTQNCFEERGGSEDVTWYSNGVHHLVAYDDGGWLILDAECLGNVVAEGRGIEELAKSLIHPRWIDERGFRTFVGDD